jgi:hypothetical protein
MMVMEAGLFWCFFFEIGEEILGKITRKSEKEYLRKIAKNCGKKL